MLRASAADMAAAVRGEKQQDEKNIMEDQEDWQEHPWDICEKHLWKKNIHKNIMEKKTFVKNIMEDQEDWQEHPWDICEKHHRKTSWKNIMEKHHGKKHLWKTLWKIRKTGKNIPETFVKHSQEHPWGIWNILKHHRKPKNRQSIHEKFLLHKNGIEWVTKRRWWRYQERQNQWKQSSWLKGDICETQKQKGGEDKISEKGLKEMWEEGVIL